MANLGVPLVFVNMGTEMLYVLAQRLRAQSIPAEKASRVLCDVVRALSGAAFVAALFSAKAGDCETVDTARLKSVFSRLTRSSAVRLNEASMEKLFDVMAVAFKYQLMSSSSVAAVTANHIGAMERMAKEDPVALAGVGALRARLEKAFSTMREGDHAELRMALLRFLQDRRPIVSMFVSDGRQNADTGAINFSVTASSMPAGGERPGTIRYFNTAGNRIREDSFQSGLNDKVFDVKPTGPPLGCDMFSPPEQQPANQAQAPFPQPSPPAPSFARPAAPMPAAKPAPQPQPAQRAQPVLIPKMPSLTVRPMVQPAPKPPSPRATAPPSTSATKPAQQKPSASSRSHAGKSAPARVVAKPNVRATIPSALAQPQPPAPPAPKLSESRAAIADLTELAKMLPPPSSLATGTDDLASLAATLDATAILPEPEPEAPQGSSLLADLQAGLRVPTSGDPEAPPDDLLALMEKASLST